MKAHIKLMGAAMLAAMAGLSAVAPAAAQGTSAFGLQFGAGNFSDDDDNSGVFYEPELALCMSDADVRRSVAKRGFTDIFLNVMDHKHVQVRATQGGYVYLLDFNYCRDKIEGAQRLRAAK